MIEHISEFQHKHRSADHSLKMREEEPESSATLSSTSSWCCSSSLSSISSSSSVLSPIYSSIASKDFYHNFTATTMSFQFHFQVIFSLKNLCNVKIVLFSLKATPIFWLQKRDYDAFAFHENMCTVIASKYQ